MFCAGKAILPRENGRIAFPASSDRNGLLAESRGRMGGKTGYFCG